MCQVIHIVIQVCFLTGLFVQKLPLVEGKYGGEIDRRALSKGRGKEFANQGTAVVHFEASVVLYFGSERRKRGILGQICVHLPNWSSLGDVREDLKE